MPAFTTVLSIAAVAGALVQAAPVERDAPKDYYVPYLEPYDTYHLRYLALDCQDKHDTSFFEDCCHPLLSTQSLSDRPAYCTPNATEIASASSYIASTSVSGVPTSTVAAVTGAASASAVASSSSVDYESSAYSAAEASSTAASAPVTQAALAPAPTTTSTSTWVAPSTTSTSQAPATTSQSNNNNGGGNSGQQTGGYATYFYQNGNPGACGNYNSDSSHIVAIDQAWWPNFGVVSNLCGRSLTIQNNNNGKTVTAIVADVCPTCANGNSLDLSVGAFTAIASESEGQVPITWWWN